VRGVRPRVLEQTDDGLRIHRLGEMDVEA